LRSFVIKNEGNLSVFVKKLRIERSECQAYGIAITNCHPFKLEPGEEKELLISYM
jgi:hypothetical protein